MVRQTWSLRSVGEASRLNEPGDRVKHEFRRNRFGAMRTGDFGQFHVVYVVLFGLPGVGIRGFASRAGENLVKLFQGLFSQRDFRGAQGGVQLLNGSGTDDGRGHDRVVQKPSQGNGRRRFAQLFA